MGNSGSAAFVKVSMDGAPYLRKVDLRMYKSYQELYDALGKMFSSFTIGMFIQISYVYIYRINFKKKHPSDELLRIKYIRFPAFLSVFIFLFFFSFIIKIF